MKCPNCHSDNRDEAKYCDECGFPLSGRIAAVAAAEAGQTGTLRALAQDVSDEQTSNQASSQASSQASRLSSNQTVSQTPAQSSNQTPTQAIDTNVEQDACVRTQKTCEMDFEGVFDFDDAEASYDAQTLDEAGDFGRASDFGETGMLSETEDNEDAELSFETNDVRDFEWDSAKTADLSGVERLVDPGYVAPQSAYRTGDTMKIPVQGESFSSTQHDFRAPEQKKHRGVHKGVIIAIVLLLCAAGAAVGLSYYFELWGGHTIPNVVGKSQADAAYELEAQGFKVRTLQVKSDDVEGKVLLSDPSAGSRQDIGEEVVIHVSVSRSIPEIVGLSQDEATSLIKDEGLENVEYVTEYSDVAKGTVLSVNPEVGQKVKASDKVVVSLATPYTVPDVTGKTLDAAKSALADASFSANVVEVYDESVKEGNVISTDPVAGSELASGSVVTLNIAKSRSAEVISATHTYFQSSTTFNIDDCTYEVNPDTLDVSYTDDNTTTYSISARVVETHEYLFFGTQTLYGDWKTISGSITWSDNNDIVSSSPTISRS